MLILVSHDEIFCVYSIEIPLMTALILYDGISNTHCRLKQFHHAISILIENNVNKIQKNSEDAVKFFMS